jgi:hypothetical protein
MTIVEIAHANPLALASGILAACECIPLLIEEFEEIKCPGFWSSSRASPRSP